MATIFVLKSALSILIPFPACAKHTDSFVDFPEFPCSSLISTETSFCCNIWLVFYFLYFFSFFLMSFLLFQHMSFLIRIDHYSLIFRNVPFASTVCIKLQNVYSKSLLPPLWNWASTKSFPSALVRVGVGEWKSKERN